MVPPSSGEDEVADRTAESRASPEGVDLVRAEAPALATHTLTVPFCGPAHSTTPVAPSVAEDCGRRMLSIYHDGAGLMVVHKPSNMLIDGAEQSVESFLSRTYPMHKFHLVHQIDYATSGIMVLALSKEAASGACRLFRERSVRKMYTAVVRGWVESDRMSISLPVAEDGKRMRVVPLRACPFMAQRSTAREAYTNVHVVKRGYLKADSGTCSMCTYARAELAGSRSRVMGAVQKAAMCAGLDKTPFHFANTASRDFFELTNSLEATSNCRYCSLLDAQWADATLDTEDIPVTLVNLELCTGRRHQLRVHLAAIGHPIVGDPLYEEVPPAGCAHYDDASTSALAESQDTLREEPDGVAGLCPHLQLLAIDSFAKDCPLTKVKSAKTGAWAMKKTTRHRMLLHSEYMLLPLHKIRKVKQWQNIDLAARIPSGFEDLVVCPCELQSATCGCGHVVDAGKDCVRKWEMERRAAILNTMRDYDAQKLQEAGHYERHDRRRQTASFQHALIGLEMAFDGAS